MRWIVDGDRGQLALAACLALCLPAIRLEGTVWLLTFGGVVALDLLPRRWRWPTIGGLALVTIVAIIAGAFGPVQIRWNSIDIPSLGTFALAWHSVGGAMVASLFTLPNWHLFWYAVPVLFVMRRQRFGSDRAARMLGFGTVGPVGGADPDGAPPAGVRLTHIFVATSRESAPTGSAATSRGPSRSTTCSRPTRT